MNIARRSAAVLFRPGNAVLSPKKAAATPILRCAGLARTYGSGQAAVVAVHEASAEIKPGSRIALTGRSGSGKSTLLHLFAGLEDPTAGTIEWPGLGGTPFGRPALVGMIFQGPSLLPALDVTENVELPLLLSGVGAGQARAWASAALHRLELDSLAPKLPQELSGGQAQRVAVARALASRPALILADEPTGQLDHEAGSLVVSVLLQAAEELGAALLISTHDETIAAQLPTRWTVRDGRLDTNAVRA